MKLGWLPGATALIAAPLMSAGLAAQSGPTPAQGAPAAQTAPPVQPPATQAPPAATQAPPAADQGAATPPPGGDEGARSDTTGLNLPDNIAFVGNQEPNVRKATAIVNGEVITESDINQRLALFVASNRITLPPEQVQAARAQILRNLIDETLEIQAAAQDDITIEPREIEEYFARFSENFNQTPQQLAGYLRSINSSDRSLKRQIQGELAWRRLQGRRIEPFVNVGDDEVQQVLHRLQASRGTTEYRVAEIFLSATPENSAEVQANADRIIQQLRAGANFAAYARQFSEATTAAVGGELGWIRPEQLPPELGQVLPQMPLGAVTNPIPLPGGFSIIALIDKRQLGLPDPRDAVTSLTQLTIAMPAGTTEAQFQARAQALAQATQNMGGCGHAAATAQAVGAEVVSNDEVRVRDLPPGLQDVVLALNVGQATQPFGSQQRVSVLVLCGRDDPPPSNGPTFDEIYDNISQTRVNNRAQRYLRDLRRDAVIDYR